MFGNGVISIYKIWQHIGISCFRLSCTTNFSICGHKWQILIVSIWLHTDSCTDFPPVPQSQWTVSSSGKPQPHMVSLAKMAVVRPKIEASSRGWWRWKGCGLMFCRLLLSKSSGGVGGSFCLIAVSPQQPAAYVKSHFKFSSCPTSESEAIT